jgi:uncharacterized protein (TIGR00251 family)
MIDCSENQGQVSFKVQVVPRASKSEIVGAHNGALRVRLAAPPVDGAANEELIRILSRALKIPRDAIEIIGGKTSKQKHLRINGIHQSQLSNLL